MTIPMWVLLGFAGWTLLTLLMTIGVYRWSRILTGQAQVKDFPADIPHGADWYRRAMRAHANCVENLPVYGAIAVVGSVAGVQSVLLDYLAIAFLVARVCQTMTHVAFEQTNRAVIIRFVFFFMQIIAMFAMGILTAIEAA